MSPTRGATTQDAALPTVADGVIVSAVGADNLRALRMDSPAEQRRLMLLVGGNGIGKSSYARLFQLLRQSTGPTREPLLWWKEHEVDFGDFKKALRRGAEEMTFTFGFTDSDGTQWQVSSVLRATDGGSRVNRVELRQGDANVTVVFDQSGTLASITGSVADTSFAVNGAETRRLLPELVADPSKLLGVPDAPEAPETLLLMTEGFFHGNTDLYRRRRIIENIPWQSDEELITYLEQRPLGQKYQQAIRTLKNDPTRVRALREARICWWALERIRWAEVLIEELARRSVYLGPFRAIPERNYRPSGSAVEQIDSRGRNLAMFLVALTPEERQDLNEYLNSSLGFRVHPQPSGGLWELHVELTGGEMFDLLDVGFGYSQVLPVAVQLWASGRILSTSRAEDPITTLVIEQPELHLHPHQQVLVARALAACASAERGPVMLVETHSDHIVGEIGMLIARGQLPAARVSVLCMEPHHDGGTHVRTATFDDDGVLHNWPTGFMSP